MPTARVATATQDQTCLRRSSERKTMKRAASVPVGQQANQVLESLRSKKRKSSLLGVEGISPSSPSSVVIARARKRDSLSGATSQADCMASTSASVAEQIADTSERRPRKRRKRSSSTPVASRSAQLSTQLPSRRRSRSRVGSPTTDVEHVPPSRVSARLLRKIHPLLDSGISDIYTHLADPDGAGNLLSEALAGSVILSTPNDMVGSRSFKRTRGSRRKVADLTDENTKRDLIEEWARMRQSQGTLPLSGINGNACSSQTLLHENRKGDGSISSMQLEMITRGNSPDADLLKSQTTTIVNISQSQETIFDSLRGSSLTQMDFENALPVGPDASGKNLDHKDSVLPSDCGTEQFIVPSLGIEAPPTSILDSHVDGDSRTGTPAGNPQTTHYPGLLQAEVLSINNPPKDNHSVTFPQTCLFDTNSIHLDSDEEFYMLEIPEVFNLPWVPVSSHLYVPPSLGKLISGMREQLMIEARARRRAEELYQAELSRRISAEKIIEDLRTELEGKQTYLENRLAERQGDGK